MSSAKTIFEIESSCINITPDLYIDEYNLFLKPSSVFLDYIASVNLPKDYLAVHIRVGDGFVNKKSNFNVDDAIIVVNKWKDNVVVVFSDNEHVKQQFKNYGFLIHEMDVFHINECKNNSLIPTIAEFFIIGFSKKVLAFNYSGFYHISSFLMGKEYNACDFNVHYNYFNTYIKIIKM